MKGIRPTTFKKGHVVPKEWREKARIANLGSKRHTTPHSEETKKKISLNRVGKTAKEKNPNWKGGVGTARHAAMGATKYKLWRLSMFERDLFTCQDCGKKGGFLMAHHIKSWSSTPELRYELDNGITYCEFCHAKNDEYFRKFYEGRILN